MVVDPSHKQGQAQEQNHKRPSFVRFSCVEIRHYPIILGDHPCVKLGAPLSIDWEHESSVSLPVNDFEQHRIPVRRHMPAELLRTSRERHAILKHAGYGDEEIKEAAQNASRDRRNRDIPSEETADLIAGKLRRLSC
jgi:hypothetical protein